MELLRDSRRNSKGVPGWTPKEFSVELRRNARWSSKGILRGAQKRSRNSWWSFRGIAGGTFKEWMNSEWIPKSTLKKFPKELRRKSEKILIEHPEEFLRNTGRIPGETRKELLEEPCRKTKGIIVGAPKEFPQEPWRNFWGISEKMEKNHRGTPEQFM